MKNSFLLLLTLFSFNAFSSEVEVVSTHLGVEDFNQEKTLCLTVVRVPETQMMVGVVEDIYDCFYARSARGKSILEVNLDKLHKIDHPELRDHLQRLDGQLEFYFSDGE